MTVARSMSFSSATIDVGMNGYRHGHPRPLRHHQHHHPQQTSTSNVKNVFDAHDENDKKGKSVGDYSAFGFGAGFGAGVGTGNESRNVGIEDEFPTSVEYMFEKIMDTVSKSVSVISFLSLQSRSHFFYFRFFFTLSTYGPLVLVALTIPNSGATACFNPSSETKAPVYSINSVY